MCRLVVNPLQASTLLSLCRRSALKGAFAVARVIQKDSSRCRPATGQSACLQATGTERRRPCPFACQPPCTGRQRGRLTAQGRPRRAPFSPSLTALGAAGQKAFASSMDLESDLEADLPMRRIRDPTRQSAFARPMPDARGAEAVTISPPAGGSGCQSSLGDGHRSRGGFACIALC